MDDLISRQAAIDSIRKIKANYCETADDQILLIDKAMAMTELMILPSAQQRWIPVTERLPEIDMSHPHHEDYLVQYDSGGIDVASWSNVNRFWTDHVTEPHWNCVQFAKVIAWMPLPEPYKEGKNG